MIDVIFLSLLTLFILSFLLFWATKLYVRSYISWENSVRRGMAFYGLSLIGRQETIRKIRFKSFWMPVVVRIEKLCRNKKVHTPSIPSIQVSNIEFPSYSCSKQSVESALRYQPTGHDVFVVSQIKSGTTWMQHLVIQLLTRGQDLLVESAGGHLAARSPWIESFDGVGINDAPLIGPLKNRIIKTHLPYNLCPYSNRSKYIYVVRHPVSCFASMVDYFDALAGDFAPHRSDLLKWYCSKNMWFGLWEDHIREWYEHAKEPNVLICRYEDLKNKSVESLIEISKFLGIRIMPEEMSAIRSKTTFDFMKEHYQWFDMCPPNFFSVRRGSFFQKGISNRYKDALPFERETILKAFGSTMKKFGYD